MANHNQAGYLVKGGRLFLEDKMRTEYRTIAVSLTQPAVRMVVIEVWLDDVDDGKVKARTWPAVAIQSSVQREYTNMDDGAELYGNEGQLLEDGWVFNGQVDVLDVVYCDGEIKTVRAENEEWDWTFLLPVSCTWQPDDDSHKLKWWVDYAKDKLQQKVARSQRIEQARKKARDKAKNAETDGPAAPAT